MEGGRGENGRGVVGVHTVLSGERGGRSGEAVVAPPPSTIMGGGLCRLGLAPGDTDEPGFEPLLNVCDRAVALAARLDGVGR